MSKHCSWILGHSASILQSNGYGATENTPERCRVDNYYVKGNWLLTKYVFFDSKHANYISAVHSSASGPDRWLVTKPGTNVQKVIIDLLKLDETNNFHSIIENYFLHEPSSPIGSFGV